MYNFEIKRSNVKVTRSHTDQARNALSNLVTRNMEVTTHTGLSTFLDMIVGQV